MIGFTKVRPYMVECFCDGEMPTIFQTDMVKARKAYRCCECCGVIEKGELHRRCKGLWDNRWDIYRTCADCLFILSEMECQCRIYGNLYDDIAGDARLEGMYVAARRKRQKTGDDIK